MMDNQKTAGKLVTLCLFPLVMAACGGEPAVSFSQDVQPIINQHCVQCHQSGGLGEIASGFDLTSYEGLMKGTRAGPMVIAGDIEGSRLSATLVSTRGRTSSAEIITLKNDLYDVKTKTLIWTAQTRTVAPESIDEAITDVVDLLVGQMISDNVIK